VSNSLSLKHTTAYYVMYRSG